MNLASLIALQSSLGSPCGRQALERIHLRREGSGDDACLRATATDARRLVTITSHAVADAPKSVAMPSPKSHYPIEISETGRVSLHATDGVGEPPAYPKFEGVLDLPNDPVRIRINARFLRDAAVALDHWLEASRPEPLSDDEECELCGQDPLREDADVDIVMSASGIGPVHFRAAGHGDERDRFHAIVMPITAADDEVPRPY